MGDIVKTLFLAILSVFILSACFARGNYAPVVNGWHEAIPASGIHTVKKGETLYSIAFRYGLDYREISTWNRVPTSFEIYPGEKLNLRPQPVTTKPTTSVAQNTESSVTSVKKTKPKPVTKQTAKKDQATKKTVKSAKPNNTKASTKTNVKTVAWQWPVKGKILIPYSKTKDGNKGIDIGGRYGDIIRAAKAGKVVYSGSGLPAYGNLIIVKHNDRFLSAYAHNSKILVKEGQWVTAGQKIAKMGNSGASEVALHFEIRRDGKPVNPSSYLPKA